MIPKRVVLATATGAAVGSIQTPLLRQYADTPMANSFLKGTTGAPLLMKPLGGFGSPSALGGIAAGAVTLGVGIYGALRGKLVRNDSVNAGLISYGSTSLFGGVMSGAFPTAAWANGVAKDPAIPLSAGQKISIRPSIAASGPGGTKFY